MKKAAVALIASLFAAGAFAQASAPAVTPAQTGAPKAHKHSTHKKDKSFTLDKSKLNGQDKLQ